MTGRDSSLIWGADPTPEPGEGAGSVWRLRFGRLRGNPRAMIAAAVLGLLALLSLAAPLIEWVNGIDAFRADLFARFEPPSAKHWLGTDNAGRDVLARLLYGGQISLKVGIVATLLATSVGTFIGLVAGYYRGLVDSLLMRLADALLALPVLPLLIVVAAIDFEKLGLPAGFGRSSDASFYRIVVIIGLVQWTTVARLVRASTLVLLNREFVLAALAEGAGAAHVVRVHILPNVVSPIVIAMTLEVGQVILFESVLSFLGLGIMPPLPSWGNMLTNAQELIGQAPLLAFYPGILIFVTVIAVNFLGDGLQEAFDPRSDPR
jgi:peptide/nickel transport system permease protein